MYIIIHLREMYTEDTDLNSHHNTIITPCTMQVQCNDNNNRLLKYINSVVGSHVQMLNENATTSFYPIGPQFPRS